MKVFAEKEAEKFLKKQDFDIVDGFFVSSTIGLKKALKKIGLPCVMKVSGPKVIHKRGIKGVKTKIRTYSEALHELRNFKRFKGATGVIIQKRFFGKEFFLGIKKTPEFEHVLVFGAGGSKVEEKKDVSFKVCPIEEIDIKKIIKETKIGKKLGIKDKKILGENILKLCELVGKYPKILELDINPFSISKGVGKVLDARIVFE